MESEEHCLLKDVLSQMNSAIHPGHCTCSSENDSDVPEEKALAYYISVSELSVSFEIHWVRQHLVDVVSLGIKDM